MSKTTSFTVAVIAIILVSCSYKSSSHRLPPGQAKKVYGTKSAQPFAPGQRKKH